MPAVWSAYEYQPSFVLGFHGCDESVGEKILRGREPHLKPSEQKYDWLGHGIYFWEGNPGRALDCAVMNTLHAYRDSRKEPAYDSVRGPFLEGNPIYPVAGFRSENHIQLCVLNTECIKGYFRPLRAEVGTLAA